MHPTTRTWRQAAALGIALGLGCVLTGCASPAPTASPAATAATAATTPAASKAAASSASTGTVTATIHGTPVTFALAPGQSAPSDGSAAPDTLLVRGMSYRSGRNMSEAYSSEIDLTVGRPMTLGEAKHEAERQLAAAPTATR